MGLLKVQGRRPAQRLQPLTTQPLTTQLLTAQPPPAQPLTAQPDSGWVLGRCAAGEAGEAGGGSLRQPLRALTPSVHATGKRERALAPNSALSSLVRTKLTACGKRRGAPGQFFCFAFAFLFLNTKCLQIYTSVN